MVIPSFTGDGMAIALSTAKDCAYEFDRRQKDLPSDVERIQQEMKKQMRWALMGQGILKFPWLINLFMAVPSFSLLLIKTIFQENQDFKKRYS